MLDAQQLLFVSILESWQSAIGFGELTLEPSFASNFTRQDFRDLISTISDSLECLFYSPDRRNTTEGRDVRLIIQVYDTKPLHDQWTSRIAEWFPISRKLRKLEVSCLTRKLQSYLKTKYWNHFVDTTADTSCCSMSTFSLL